MQIFPISTILLLLVFFKTGASTTTVETNSGDFITDDLMIGDVITNNLNSLKEVEKEIEELVKSISKTTLTSFVRNFNSNVSSSCMSTLMKMFVDLRNLKLPVIKMLDAMFKPPSGILKGSLSFMGDYDECLEVKVNSKGDAALNIAEEVYHGQYCLVEVEFPPALINSYMDYRNNRINVTAFGKLKTLIDELPVVGFADDNFGIKAGVCIPSTCTKHDLQELLLLLPLTGFPMLVKHCKDGQIQKLNNGQILFITFIILFGTFVVLGTILEMCLNLKISDNKDQKKKLIQFLLAFSMYRNTKKLMKLETNSTTRIPVITGMYVIGSLLVIIYHTYLMPFFFTFASHGLYLIESMTDWKFTLISTMGISIDAYFLFSGIFIIYPRYRGERKEVKINIFKIIVRRYIRFASSMMVILGIIISLPLIGSGPVWAEIFDVAAENAQKWWWTYLLMFNNFLEIEDQSFFPLWFLPCLMQVTVIGAVLLWSISKNVKFGIFLTIATCLSCNIALGLLTYIRNYPLTNALYYYHKREYAEITIYTSPLSHVSSFGVGMLLGYFMAKTHILKLSRTRVTLGWICSLFLIIGTHFFPYMGHEGQDLDPILSAVFAATHRMLYLFGMSWMIMACTYGYGGVLTEFLSWNGFGILAKLSYSGYLIHYIVIAYHTSFTRMPLAFSHYEAFVRYSGYVTVTILASYLFYTTFELPMSYIESLLLPKGSDLNVQSNINNQIDVKCVNGDFWKGENYLNPNILKSPMWEEPKSSEAEDSKM